MEGGSKIKIAGMVGAVIVVVGVMSLMYQSKFPGKGVSADLGDVAAGSVVVMSEDTYESVLADLRQYFEEEDESTRDNIISGVVKSLEEVLE